MLNSRVPKGFQKLLAVHFGAGYDRHGQDATAAAVQAVQRALENTTQPGIVNFVPGGFDGVKVALQTEAARIVRR